MKKSLACLILTLFLAAFGSTLLFAKAGSIRQSGSNSTVLAVEDIPRPPMKVSATADGPFVMADVASPWCTCPPEEPCPPICSPARPALSAGNMVPNGKKKVDGALLIAASIIAAVRLSRHEIKPSPALTAKVADSITLAEIIQKKLEE